MKGKNPTERKGIDTGRMHRLAAGCLALLSLFMLYEGGLRRSREHTVEAARMKNVDCEFVIPASPQPQATATPEASPGPTAAPAIPAEPVEAPAAEGALPDEAGDEAALFPSADGADIRETTIEGGLSIRNHTSYEVDAAQLLADGARFRLPAEGAQILIIHTHSSEAYTPAGLDRYTASDGCRTEDPAFNIIRVGDELTALWQEAGLQVIHDRGVYDYPSYTGSYSRSGEAVSRCLEENPGIAIVIDMHRDAIGSGDAVYKIMAEEEGVVASQIMLLVGTDESGLEHPNWRSNLALALLLQRAVTERWPSLMRPVDLVPQRYNQHLTGGSLILEVGSSGNTLQEALAAIRLFAAATAPALLELVEETEMNEA